MAYTDVMKYAQIKNEDGTIIKTIPIGVDATYVDIDGKQLTEVINEYVKRIELAPIFDQDSRYEIGEYVIYNNKLYVITQVHIAGKTWNNTQKTEIKLGNEIQNFIKVSDTQPSGTGNRIWIDSSASSSQEIPTYNEMMAEIQALKNTIAPTFSINTIYEVGSYVYYQNQLYRITARHSSNVSWANTSKEKVTIGGELKKLN